MSDLNYMVWNDSDVYKNCLLIKDSSFNRQQIEKYYSDIVDSDLIAYAIPYDNKGKKHDKNFIKEIIPVLQELGVKNIYIADANLFKQFTKEKKAEARLGYEHEAHGFKVTLGVNYSSLMYNPANHEKLTLSLETFKGMIDGQVDPLGAGIIHRADYVLGLDDMRNVLNRLTRIPVIAADIETRSLKFWEAGIVSIAFAIDEHSGVAIFIDNDRRKLKLLREFFENYQGKIIWHNSNYDLKVLIYTLFMERLGDTAGLLHGLDVMTRNFEDTKILSYIALNSVVRPSYSLKDLCHGFAGNYAVEIEDIDSLDTDEILEYNLIDTLCTYWLYKKYPIQTKEDEALYRDMLMATAKVLLQTELTGMPISMDKVYKLREELISSQKEITAELLAVPEVVRALDNIQTTAMLKKNSTLKKKKHTIEMYRHMQFNFNSTKHLQELLYETMDLPVIEKTDTGDPSTSKGTLEKLKNHVPKAKEESYLNILDKIIQKSAIDKILTSFIPAFIEYSQLTEHGYRLFGNFNIGGTASGRLSSSNPNLQNIPSGSVFGKKIKECFVSMPGMVFCGADFFSLEDRINTLLTRDPNKEAVYLHGYDGHSLRAYSYWPDKIDIPQIKEGDQTKCFKITIEDSVYYVTENDVIKHNDQEYLVSDLIN